MSFASSLFRPCSRLRPLPALLVLILNLGSLPASEGNFVWQIPQARVLPQGDLEYTPTAFQFVAGQDVRYVDFANGDDEADGRTRETAWKHHPWDPAAGGQSKAFAPKTGVTYVFKGGVEYRGSLVAPPRDLAPSSAEEPIRLTADPTWGEGRPILLGSEPVRNWTRGGLPEMPEPDKVWRAEVDFAPRTLWLVQADGAISRLPLARHPNWHESDPQDPMAEWPTWENPEWWKNDGRLHVTKVGGKERHVGISREVFDRPASDYVGATVWTEWGIVMGSPYPAQIEAFDEEKKGAAFRGPWTFEISERIMTGNRFHLEDKAWMLDEPGEFFVVRQGAQATIFFWPPDDVDPNSLRLEAGKRLNFLDATELGHLEVRGLQFQFTGQHWDYNIPRWAHPDLMNAAIRIRGPAESLTISHCLFQFLNGAARIDTASVRHQIPRVEICDNHVRETDHGAFIVQSHFGEASDLEALQANPAGGRVGHINFLRNRLEKIGWRNLSGEHGHAVDLNYPHSSVVAGNFLHRIAGWGLAVFGGKPSSESPQIAALDAPMSRHLIFHNRVEDVLLKSNDWGGIETWQGGPFYVWANLVINPRAFKNWTYIHVQPDGIPSFGHAYYLDGSYKNYLFNNIAMGRSSALGTKDVNTSAIQGILGFENTFLHNTLYRFANGTRQQAPDASRLRFLGNILQDITAFDFRNADPNDTPPDPNAEHYKQGGAFNYPTLGYAGNVFYETANRFVFEETGAIYTSLRDFSAALEKVHAQASSVGRELADSPLRDPARGDFRPTGSLDPEEDGLRVFVPWGLRGVVGEWNFVQNQSDPALIIDTHWYMHGAYGNRDHYRLTPRFPLRGVKITAENYVAGPLENWGDGPGALQLNGRDQYLVLPHAELVPSGAVTPSAMRTVNIQHENFLLELYLRSETSAGCLVRKMPSQGPGYALELSQGRPTLRLRDAEGRETIATAEQPLRTSQWHHLLVEADRAQGIRFYLDGKMAGQTPGPLPAGSLRNTADFLVGGGPDLPGFSGALEFLRIAQGTLADADTTIEELHAWEFEGPQFRDFTGNSRSQSNPPGALVR